MKTQTLLPVELRKDLVKMSVKLIENENFVPLDLYLKAVSALELCEHKLLDVCENGQGTDLRNFCGLSVQASQFVPLD